MRKLNSFAHSNDPFIKRITRGDAPLQNMSDGSAVALTSTGVAMGRHGRRTMENYRLSRGGHNPIAPLRFNMTDLAREQAAVRVELARASGTPGAKAVVQMPRGWSMSRGKLSSIDAEIDARRREGDMVTQRPVGEPDE